MQLASNPRGQTPFSTSRADRQLWQEFTTNPEALAHEAEATAEAQSSHHAPRDERPSSSTQPPAPPDSSSNAHPQRPVSRSETATLPTGPTDTLTLTRTRRIQSFFRAAVLTSYDSRCALTGLAVPSLLVASHIIPWSQNIPRRADPTNGLCLSALFDRAFDRGLITFDEDLRLVLSRDLKHHLPTPRLPCLLTAAAGQPLQLPTRFLPDSEALSFHRETIFLD